MAIREWWRNSANERYWLEITDRPDIGVDLKAPQLDDDAQEFWSYSLVTHVENGDIVFHYDKNAQAVTSWSRIAGGYWQEDIVWAARGTSARGSNVQPYKRPGWKVGLVDHASLATPLSLENVRAARDKVLAVEAALEARYGKPLYLPFTRYSDTLRPQQGYLTKLPERLLDTFQELRDAVALANATAAPPKPLAEAAPEGVGVSYREADEETSVSDRDPMFPDPALIERGNRGHARAQNVLAKHLKAHALIPLSPRPGEPNYDLAWQSKDLKLFVVEVKSLTIANEERQLRLALGQVLRYAQLLSADDRPATPVVMAEREPSDPSWALLCQHLGVLLLWPECLTEKLP